jgi:hypothetical protein
MPHQGSINHPTKLISILRTAKNKPTYNYNQLTATKNLTSDQKLAIIPKS